MLRFHEFLREHPHETEHRVPVSMYLQSHQIPPFSVETVYAAARGLTHTQTVTLPLSALVPTQEFVNNYKIVNGTEFEGVLVRLHNGIYWIIDGHHRACRAALLRLSEITVSLV